MEGVPEGCSFSERSDFSEDTHGSSGIDTRSRHGTSVCRLLRPSPGSGLSEGGEGGKLASVRVPGPRDRLDPYPSGTVPTGRSRRQNPLPSPQV